MPKNTATTTPRLTALTARMAKLIAAEHANAEQPGTSANASPARTARRPLRGSLARRVNAMVKAGDVA